MVFVCGGEFKIELLEFFEYGRCELSFGYGWGWYCYDVGF